MRSHDLRALLAAVRRRWRTQMMLRVTGRAAALVAAPLVGAALVARLLTLSDAGLVALVIITTLAALAGVFLIARTIPRRPSDRQIARFIEERTAERGDLPPFEDVLVSATDVDRNASQPFHAFVVESAIRRLERIGPSDVVPAPLMRRASLEALTGAAVLVVAGVVAWPLLGRVAESAWIAFFPQTVHVEVLPGDARIVAGKPLRIRAAVRTGARALTRFTPKLTVTAGSEERSVAMTPDGQGFEFSFASIDRTFRYRVTAGSARSQEYTVTALVSARVRQIDLRYDYPSFANLAPRDEKNGGDIYAPAGTKVHVRVHTDKPVMSGQLALGGEKSATLAATDDRVLEGDLVLAKDDSYRVGLLDRDGLRSAGDTEYFIRVMDDRPPDVRIIRPGGDQQITPLEEVAIEARAEDDYGIAGFELVYAVAGRAPVVIPLSKATGTDTARVATHVLQTEDLRVQPGDVITYYARARDVARGKRATEARSDMFFLEVRPFAEEFVAAQSQAQAGMASEQIDALIAAQKEIISATWNIERRATSGAGRSADDITAIASAQAEVKTRAEQLSPGPVRGRSGFQLPEAQDPRSGQRRTVRSADPVSSAISAMTRAIDQLQGQRTSDALPHEMAALQGLLQAQAEVRRREVMQQTGTGMGGSGRQGQDLSALFDKELQRQQRTNYETRSQIEQRPDRENDRSQSAVDRIRELARRQEELSKQERQLANSGASPEEIKRALEKLTREQEELRQQAEASGMREVAEQMRSAASELQRQSPGSAADRAEQAAARLRSLEQQMGGDSAESRQRAAGEARLEAQQIAEEQRRIAAEAERLEKGGSAGNADAWRRLAGENEKLAERVEALERGAQQPGRDLQRERVAERMRDTAKQIREATAERPNVGRGASPAPSAPKVADAEQQIARAVDRIVDQLGDQAASREGTPQELARQLDQTRAIRERLDTLEQQIHDAESKGASAEAQRLRDQHGQELQRARQTLSRLERSSSGAAPGGTSPEQHEWSQTDQGTEAFKQDFSQWASLKKDVHSALDRYDASVIAKAARKSADQRLSAGGSDRVPDAYRRLIARYYESLARKK
jgi:Domain of unknown function (DUF4175)